MSESVQIVLHEEHIRQTKKKMLIIIVVVLSCSAFACAGNCTPSITTASGSAARSGPICSGDLIFVENFDNLDKKIWEPEVTLWGGGVSIVFFSNESTR